MSADDAAARYHGPRTVAAAIAAMGHRAAPAGALGAAGPSALRRGRRLCATEAQWRSVAGRLAVAVTVVALAAGPYAFNLLPLCPPAGDGRRHSSVPATENLLSADR